MLAEEALQSCEEAEALARIPTSIKNKRLVPCQNILLSEVNIVQEGEQGLADSDITGNVARRAIVDSSNSSDGFESVRPRHRKKNEKRTLDLAPSFLLLLSRDSNLFVLLMRSVCARAAPPRSYGESWSQRATHQHSNWKPRSRTTFDAMCTLAMLGSASRVLRLSTASGIEELRLRLQESLRKEFVPFSPIAHFNSVGSGFGLCHFAEQGDIMKCREYIAAGADVTFEDDVEFKSDGTAPFGVRVGKEYWAAIRTPLSCAYAAASSTVIRLLLACGAAPDICLGSGWEDIHFEDKCKELQETCQGRMLRVSVGHPTWGSTRPLRLGHQNEVFVSEAGGKVMTLKEHIARREQGNLESMWQWACDVRGVKNEKLLQLVRKTSEEWRTEAEVTRNGNRYTQWQELHRHPLE